MEIFVDQEKGTTMETIGTIFLVLPIDLPAAA